MAVTYTSFIVAFPEFGNTSAYPESQVDFWLGQAVNQLNAARFGKSYDLATMLFVAHNIVLSAASVHAAAVPDAAVGASFGVVSSKTVGPVSKSYDNSLTSSTGAGEYNATSYGQRLYRLLRAAGAGPVYVPGRPAYPPIRLGYRSF